MHDSQWAATRHTWEFPCLYENRRRAPDLKDFSAFRITSPYNSASRPPKPETLRSSARVTGRARQSSSNVVSCITMKAGTPNFLLIVRRHLRIYSQRAL